jgi:hypothetical protein
MDWSRVGLGIRWFEIFSCLVLFSVLLSSRLFRKYSALTLFIGLEIVVAFATIRIQTNTTLYGNIYFVNAFLRWALIAFIVVGLYRAALQNHPGLATVGRWVLSGGILIAAVVSLVSLGPDLANRAQKFPILLAVHVTERALATTLAVLILIMVAFLSWFPVRLPKNVIFLVFGWGALLVFRSAILLFRNALGPETAVAASAGMIGLSGMVNLFWAVRLRQSGEERAVTVRHVAEPEEAERLVRRLDAINSALIRSSTKS